MKSSVRKSLVITSLICVIMQTMVVAQTKPSYPKLSDGKYGFYGSDGTLTIAHNYDDALGFNQGLAAVKKDGKWGYIDLTGTLIIDYKYDDAWYFTESLAAVKKGAKWGYISKAGKVMIDFKYDDAGDFSDGLAWVKSGDNIGYIDSEGNTKIDFNYGAANAFAEDLMAVQKDGIWGFINKSGATVVDFKYDAAGVFLDGLAPVKKDGYWGYIDDRGKIMYPLTLTKTENDYMTTEFAWVYAATAYKHCQTDGSGSTDYSGDQKHLKKAVDTVESKVLYPTVAELEQLLIYYTELGDTDKISETKKRIKEAKYVPKIRYRSSGDVKLNIATQPIRLGLYKYRKQIPIYAELQFDDEIALGIRFCKITDYTDKWRFGAWSSSNDYTNTYSGYELSFDVKFLEDDDEGQFAGFEVRYNSYNFDPDTISYSTLGDYSIVSTNTSAIITPTMRSTELSFYYGVFISQKHFYLDCGFNIGIGYRKFDMSPFNPDIHESVGEGGKYNKENYWTWYIPLRFSAKLGFSLGG